MDRRRSLLKIAALRSEREQQVGVNIGKEQNIDSSSITAFIGAPVPIGTGDFTLEYFGNAYWATKSKTPLIFNDSTHSTYSKGCFLVYGDSELAIRWVLFEAPMSGAPTDDSILLSAGDRETPFHFALTRKGTTVKVYFNGNLEATKEQSAVKDLGDFWLGMSNGSNMVMSRIYNYAISAEEVAALYNDGDPAGYVLPTIKKYGGPFGLSGITTYTWTGETDANYYRELLLGRTIQTGAVVIVKGSVSDYQSGEPFVYVGNRQAMLPAQNGDFTVTVVCNRDNIDRIYYYGGTVGSDRRLTITIDEVVSIGCIAEYLPQNLVGQWHEKPVEITGITTYTWTGETDPVYYQELLLGRFIQTGAVVMIKGSVSDYQSGEPFVYVGNRQAMIPAQNGSFTLKVINSRDNIDRIYYYGGTHLSDRRITITIDSVELIPDVALSWLDSARKLPLNDEYLPPLLQSDGGYDLTASGTPEIIIK